MTTPEIPVVQECAQPLGRPIECGITVIATLKNEANAVGPYLRALAAQTYTPDAVILVDGGSEDGTVARIGAECPPSLTVTVRTLPGANRSAGRNAAIRMATTPLIACTDVGSLPAPGWLAALLRPFEVDPATDVVAGFYAPDLPGTRLQDAMSALVCPRPQDVDPARWVPSARSLGFRRSAWKAVGGFPEECWHNEDTPFVLRLRRARLCFAFAPEAVVRWSPQPTARTLWRQYARYGRGDGQGLLYPRQHAIMATAYLGPLAVATMGSRRIRAPIVAGGVWGIYCWMRTRKAWHRLHSGRSAPLLPIALALFDLASIKGYLAGLLDRCSGTSRLK